MKKPLFVTLLPAMLLLGVLSAEAANHHVRAEATGSATGNDWTNAYPSLPSNLTRGDNYYIANGTYPGRTFNTPASGTSVITIKGATEAEHGSDIGWSPSLSVDTRDGGSQAIWTGDFWFSTSYWVFDGAVHGTPTAAAPWNFTKSAYGFKIGATTTPAGSRVFEIYNTSATVTDITLSNIVATSANATGSGGSCPGQTYFIATNDSTKSVNNLHMRYLFVENYENTVWGTSPGPTHAGWIFERSISYRGYSDASCHGEDLNNNYGNILDWTIRYNWFEGRTSGTSTINAGLNGRVGTFYIYGNVFKDQQAGNGVIACIKGSGTVYVHNNTFINSPLPDGGPWLGGQASFCTLAGEAKNNLLYNMRGNSGDGVTVTESFTAGFATTSMEGGANQYLASGNPFTNITGHDASIALGIASAMPPGTTITNTAGQTFNVDILGNVRGADGKWDRGAIEFGGSLDTIPPSSPTNVRIQ